MNILKSMDDVIAAALDKGFKEVLFYYSGNGINVSNAKKRRIRGRNNALRLQE